MANPIADDFYPWLNKELLENALKASENSDTVQLIDFKLFDAVKKGENYSSHLMRASVDFKMANCSTIKHKSFIVKTTLAPELNAKFENVAFFRKEVAFYRDILPKLDNYLDKIDKNFAFTARCFAASDEPAYLVFEDLKEKEFRNMDRHSGLNFKAIAMVLEKLAKYHAMTAMICCEQPKELYDVFQIKMIDSNDKEMLKLYLCGIKDCQEVSRNWPGYEHLSPKLERFAQIVIDKVGAESVPDDSEFNVINHGDLWANNIMFKFDEDHNPIDVVVVDFQIVYYGSPAFDLAYLLRTSTTNDCKEAEWDRLIEIYHAELVRSLKAVNYQKRIPNLMDIQIHLLKRSLYAVMISLLILTARHMDQTEFADFSLFDFENEKLKKVRQELYERPEVKERLQYLLDYYDRKGFLQSN